MKIRTSYGPLALFTCQRDDAYERYHADPRKAVFIPFYPLPYRDKRGGILFPASGYGWYTRDDVLAAIAWLERLVPDFPRSTRLGLFSQATRDGPTRGRSILFAISSSSDEPSRKRRIGPADTIFARRRSSSP
jgi:hypothetical protein